MILAVQPVCSTERSQLLQDIPQELGTDVAGWRAFAACPELEQDCPGPYFMEGIDSSSLILEAIDKQLFGKRSAPEASPAAVTPASPWWQGITTNLRKVCFLPLLHCAVTNTVVAVTFHHVSHLEIETASNQNIWKCHPGITTKTREKSQGTLRSACMVDRSNYLPCFRVVKV